MTDKRKDTGQRIPLHRTAILTAVMMALILAVSGGACFLFYQNITAPEKFGKEVRQNASLSIAEHRMFDSLRAIVSDLKFLGSQHEIIPFLIHGSASAEAELTHHFLTFARHKGVYDQVRLLNAQGREVVRVDFNDGRPEVVAADGLQDKGGRYYFKEAAASRRDAVCISALDLNVENGKVQRPFKPMIRFSQPVFSKDDRFLGVLVLNYLGKVILDRIRHEDLHEEGDLMLISSDGYWLLNPNPELEWGFMLPERGAFRFSRSFSEEWQAISGGEEGQFSTPKGLFAYKAFSPGRRVADAWNCEVKISPRSQKWLFVNHISTEALHRHHAGLRTNLFILWAVMAFFAAAPAWLLASVFLKRRQTQHQMWRMANFDALTGLFNRSSFMHALKQAVELGERYGRNFALLYLDLDGFKQVNDTLGHAAGDQVLQQTAERFRTALRSSDCVARLGGDEFCLIIREIDTAAEAAKVADKLIGALAAPFDLNGRTGRVGISIGIALFPEDDGGAEGLLKIADKAMYAAKAGGKNRYCFSRPEFQEQALPLKSVRAS